MQAVPWWDASCDDTGYVVLVPSRSSLTMPACAELYELVAVPRRRAPQRITWVAFTEEVPEWAQSLVDLGGRIERASPAPPHRLAWSRPLLEVRLGRVRFPCAGGSPEEGDPPFDLELPLPDGWHELHVGINHMATLRVEGGRVMELQAAPEAMAFGLWTSHLLAIIELEYALPTEGSYLGQ